jgi:16S rRNA processing protein RimM
LTDWPERLRPGSELYLDGEEEPRRVDAFEGGRRVPVVRLSGIASREAAEALRGRFLEVAPRDLPPGSYFWHQLVGLRAVDPDGALLGTVTEVFRAGENEVYVIAGADGSELLIPALRSIVRSIDIEEGVMVVDHESEEVR